MCQLKSGPMKVYRQVVDCVEKEEDMDIGGSSNEEEVAEMKWQEMKAEADDHYNTHATGAMASVLQRLAAQPAADVENDEEDELVPTDKEDGYEVSQRRFLSSRRFGLSDGEDEQQQKKVIKTKASEKCDTPTKATRSDAAEPTTTPDKSKCDSIPQEEIVVPKNSKENVGNLRMMNLRRSPALEARRASAHIRLTKHAWTSLSPCA